MRSTAIVRAQMPARKGETVTADTKRVIMRCPAREGEDGLDRCGDPITVYYGETGTDMWYVESVTPCRYHQPGETWDAPYTIAELEQRLNEGEFTFTRGAA